MARELGLEDNLGRTTRRLNILLILLVVELAPIALLAFYFLAMFVLYPPFSGD